MKFARPTALASFALAVSLALTLARGQTAQPAATTAPATTTTTSPTTVPEKIVDNPRYHAWAKFKPGTTLELEMTASLAAIPGQVMATHITQTLKRVTPEEVELEATARMSIPGFPKAQDQTQNHTVKAMAPESEALRGHLPLGADGEETDLGEEPLTVAGKTYTCRVIEFTGKIQNVPAKGKQWRSPEIPGGLVKLETESAGNKMVVEVKKVNFPLSPRGRGPG